MRGGEHKQQSAQKPGVRVQMTLAPSHPSAAKSRKKAADAVNKQQQAAESRRKPQKAAKSRRKPLHSLGVCAVASRELLDEVRIRTEARHGRAGPSR